MKDSGSFSQMTPSRKLLVLELNRTLICLVFHLLPAEDNVSNSIELSAEMDSISSNRRRFAPNRDLASTYFDQRIPIPQDEDVSLLLKSNKNVNSAANL